jgi:hypothetical protein
MLRQNNGLWHRDIGDSVVRTVLFVSTLLAICVILAKSLHDHRFTQNPLSIAVLFLPTSAVCGLGIDLVMANLAPLTGMFIARVLLPLTTLFILALVNNFVDHFTATVAIACYGAGSVAGVIYCVTAFLKSSPQELLITKPDYHRKEWLPQYAYFSAFEFLATWTVKVSLIVLKMLPVPDTELACFTAAMETGCLILLLAKSTDKLFQPEMSVILSQKSWDAGKRLRRTRYWLVGTGCGLFMVVIVLFGKSILRLYGPAFVPGYPALCAIAFGASLTTMFSLAPAFLRFFEAATGLSSAQLLEVPRQWPF